MPVPVWRKEEYGKIICVFYHEGYLKRTVAGAKKQGWEAQPYFSTVASSMSVCWSLLLRIEPRQVYLGKQQAA
jgi:hypothetical protein